MNTLFPILLAITVCGCTHKADPYHLNVNGENVYFCVPDAHRVRLPFGFPETDPKRDEGFAFSGCPRTSDARKCPFPRNVSGGAVSPLVRAVRWEWKDFPPGTRYHELFKDMSSMSRDDVRIFDEGRMLRVVATSNLADVFFWTRTSGQRFRSPPTLHVTDRLVAVCQHPGTDYKDQKRQVDAIQRRRYTTSSEYALSYTFSMDQISLQKVQDLDYSLHRAIDRWKCKAAP